MFEPLLELGLARGIDAFDRSLVVKAAHQAMANRAMGRHDKHTFSTGPQSGHGLTTLGITSPALFTRTVS